MTVFDLIDQLDDLVHKAKPVPLTDQVRVSREEVYAILDLMRATLPEAIKQGNPTIDDAIVGAWKRASGQP